MGIKSFGLDYTSMKDKDMNGNETHRVALYSIMAALSIWGAVGSALPVA